LDATFFDADEVFALALIAVAGLGADLVASAFLAAGLAPLLAGVLAEARAVDFAGALALPVAARPAGLAAADFGRAAAFSGLVGALREGGLALAAAFGRAERVLRRDVVAMGRHAPALPGGVEAACSAGTRAGCASLPEAHSTKIWLRHARRTG
jgi:hypothetical protein